jgi:hypothetical protein
MRFPKMIYRDGTALPEHGVDYCIVECEAELVNALTDGWREGLEAHEAAPRHPLDHDGDGRPGGSPAGENATRRRGRPRKAD